MMKYQYFCFHQFSQNSPMQISFSQNPAFSTLSVIILPYPSIFPAYHSPSQLHPTPYPLPLPLLSPLTHSPSYPPSTHFALPIPWNSPSTKSPSQDAPLDINFPFPFLFPILYCPSKIKVSPSFYCTSPSRLPSLHLPQQVTPVAGFVYFPGPLALPSKNFPSYSTPSANTTIPFPQNRSFMRLPSQVKFLVLSLLTVAYGIFMMMPYVYWRGCGVCSTLSISTTSFFLLSSYWTVSRYSQPAGSSTDFFFTAMQFPIFSQQNQNMQSLIVKLEEYHYFVEKYKENRKKEVETIDELETKEVLYTMNIERYGHPFQLKTPDMQLTKKLQPKFTSLQSIFSLVQSNLFEPNFLQDLTLIFPHQLTIFRLLSSQPQNLKPIYQSLMNKVHHKAAFTLITSNAKSILNRANWRIQDYSEKRESGQVIAEELDLDKILSERMTRKTDLQSTVSHQSELGKSMSLRSGDTIKKEENMRVLTRTVMSILDGLFQYQRLFNIKLKYVMKLQSKDIEGLMLNWVKIIENQLRQNSQNQYRAHNAKIAMNILKNAIKNPDAPYIEKLYEELVKESNKKLTKFFQNLLNIDQNYIQKYESRRTICCFSGVTLYKMGILEQSQQNVAYYFNIKKFMQAQPFRKQERIQQKFAQVTYSCPFVKMQNYEDIFPLLTSSWKPQQFANSLDFLTQDLKQLTLLVESQTRSVNDYRLMLEHITNKNLDLLKVIEKHAIKSQVLNIWSTLVVQKGLTLTITEDSINFGIDEFDSYDISTLGQFAQCFAYSSIISKRVRAGKNIQEINNALSQYLGLVCTALRKKHNSEQFFEAVRDQLMSFFYQEWGISEGKSIKDMKIHEYCKNATVSLKDFDLQKYQDQQEFFIELTQSCFDKIQNSTNITIILSAFIEMVNRVHYIMKVVNPKSVVSGDSQMDVLNFLISRSKIKNLSSLINFIDVCWYMEEGSFKYIITNLRSIQQYILGRSTK